MPTDLLPTRTPPETSSETRESLSAGLRIALGMHGVAALALIAAAWFSHRDSHHWGDQSPIAGSIQASMVNSLPLPPRQRFRDKEVLTSDNPSIAPKVPPPSPEPRSKATPAPSKTEAPPRPKEILIPDKVKPTKNAKPDTHPQPETPRRSSAPPPPPTPKATTGETAGVQIPMSVTQLKNGTASITVDDRTFGDRYAYYIKLISQKIAQSKSEGDPDSPETRGKHTMVRFVIDRDGTPTDASIETRSGSPALDTSTLRAIQRIDTFGPLPQGNHFVVHFEYDSH